MPCRVHVQITRLNSDIIHVLNMAQLKNKDKYLTAFQKRKIAVLED